MNKIFALLLCILFSSCTDHTVMEKYDVAQKPGEVNIKGFSKPDALQLRFNGEPISIDGKTSYTNKIETTLQFVIDQEKSTSWQYIIMRPERKLYSIV